MAWTSSTTAAAMVQIRHVREPTLREGVAAHMAKFDDDVTVRNNARLYGDDRERALGERAGMGRPGAEREKKKKPPRRDVSTQRQKVRTRVTDCNSKDRPARVRGGSAHSGQGRLGAEREKKNPPGGTSAHRDRKRELRLLTATARTGLQE